MLIKPVPILRLLKINVMMMRTQFVSHVLGNRFSVFRTFRFLNPWYYKSRSKSSAVIVRETLESLGPVYVKFGQLLSTRNDLLSDEMIGELKKLQDRVPPFDSETSKKIIEQALCKPISELFATFDDTPLASASVAQVHAATLKTGEAVIVKVIRPELLKIIKQDIALLLLVAQWTEKWWRHGKRLRPVALVQEFERTIYNELDLQQEAANASLLRKNFEHATTLYVPRVYWHYVTTHVMVMERVYGIPLNDLDALRKSGANMKTLSERGVDIFFTQVFRDGFFHADMHPGNLFIDVTDPEDPRYIGVDFGIMGTLVEEDQHYLAMNLIAFFNRDYRGIAKLHVASGWVASDTRIDQFEAAIRTVCEPIFEKPLSEISFGNLLLRLFQTAERFHMTVQPQLLLLQKTLFNIESLGRQLYPDLDLWATAKPFMMGWLREQKSIKKLVRRFLEEFHKNAETVIELPKLFSVLVANMTDIAQHFKNQH